MASGSSDRKLVGLHVHEVREAVLSELVRAVSSGLMNGGSR